MSFRLIKISQKKTCANCRAHLFGKCDLGYDTADRVYNNAYMLSEAIPLEPCPKPMNYVDLEICESAFCK